MLRELAFLGFALLLSNVVSVARAFPLAEAADKFDNDKIANSGSSNSALLTSCVICIVAVIGTVMLQPTAGPRHKASRRANSNKHQNQQKSASSSSDSNSSSSNGNGSDSESETEADMGAKEFALCLWDIAKKASKGGAARRDELLERHKGTMEALLKRCETAVGAFPAKDAWCLQTLACALVDLGLTSLDIFNVIPAQAMAMKHHLDAKAMSLLLWSFSKAGKIDTEFFDVMAREAELRIREFNPQDLTNTAWAFATAGIRDEELFKRIASESLRRMDQFNAQNTCNLAWAFARLKIANDPLFAALAQRVQVVKSSFIPQAARMTAWAFKEMRLPCPVVASA